MLRIVVSISGRLLIAAGLVLILILPVDTAQRMMGSLAWLAVGRSEIKRLEVGNEVCRAIRVDSNGEFTILDDDGNSLPARLLTGSVLLRKLGWIRLQDQNGRIFLELIRGDARQSQDWRRLQVIWRHFGA